jgi:large subunit ribosomal protein L18
MVKNKNKNRVFRFNRRTRGLTDYHQRLKLLKSGLTRAVIRRTNNNMIVQLVDYDQNGDKILTSARSVDLKKLGYDLHTGNMSAAYLTGMLAGKRFLNKKLSGDVIVDLGLQKIEYGSRLFAAVKGLVDIGVSIKVGDAVFPEDSRIKGEHLIQDNAVEVVEKTIKAIEGLKN